MTKEQNDFIKNIAAACAEHSSYQILPSMTIAQAIKESNWGKSKLSANYYNFFGMKWKTGCKCDYIEMPTKEWNGYQYVNTTSKFRRYYSFSEGIKGYYDFISGYKRYNNLIGEKNSYNACIKIQQDGWATDPSYGLSLYNNYVIPFNLLIYDTGSDGSYTVGSTYTLLSNLYLRDSNGNQKDYANYHDITVDAQVHSHVDGYGKIILNSGTRVTVKSIKEDNGNIWLEIPSGFICAFDGSKYYVV